MRIAIENIDQMLSWDSQENFDGTFRCILLKNGAVQLLETIGNDDPQNECFENVSDLLAKFLVEDIQDYQKENSAINF